MDINNFFKDLNQNIRNAKTKKALKILEHRVKKFVSEIESNTLIKSTVKKEVIKKYRASKDLLNKKYRSL